MYFLYQNQLTQNAYLNLKNFLRENVWVVPFSWRPRIAKILFQKPVLSEQFRFNPCPIFWVGKYRFLKNWLVRVRLNIQAFAVSSTACTVLSVSNRLQDLSLPDVTRIDSDFECEKVSREDIFIAAWTYRARNKNSEILATSQN